MSSAHGEQPNQVTLSEKVGKHTKEKNGGEERNKIHQAQYLISYKKD